jgi:hypothetical protein
MTIEATVCKPLLRTLENGIGSGPNKILIGAKADIYRYGFADIAIGISADYFREIAEAMMTANPDEASKAFGHALKDGIGQRTFKPLHITSDEELKASLDEGIRRANEAQSRAVR